MDRSLRSTSAVDRVRGLAAGEWVRKGDDVRFALGEGIGEGGLERSVWWVVGPERERPARLQEVRDAAETVWCVEVGVGGAKQVVRAVVDVDEYRVESPGAGLGPSYELEEVVVHEGTPRIVGEPVGFG